jgi:hypothetical protein
MANTDRILRKGGGRDEQRSRGRDHPVQLERRTNRKRGQSRHYHERRQGLFSIQGERGPTLSVAVSKEGYHAAQGARRAFSFGSLAPAQFAPDQHNPVLFLLHKKGPGVHLVSSQSGMRPDLALRVPTDNTPFRLDLLRNEAGTSGQLEISQNKPPLNAAVEWAFRLSLLDGGLLENGTEFPFEAPETGYTPTVELRFHQNQGPWSTHIKKTYYIAFGQPVKYGTLRVETDLSQQTVFLRYAINPTGSRDLEPSEQISAPPVTPEAMPPK